MIRMPYGLARAAPPVKNKTTLVQDKHHCRCHRIDPSLVPELEDAMRSHGFEDVLQEDHGQAFGLRYRLSRREQLHVKVMPGGLIEAEIEPPPEYPLAHRDQKHSYSAHAEVDAMLRGWGIGLRTARAVPETCLYPVVVPPDNPPHISDILFGVVTGVGVATGVYLLDCHLKGRRP